MQSYLKIYSATLFLLGVLVSVMGCTPTVEAPRQVDTGTVSLSVDFPSDSQQDDIDAKVGCSDSATVFEVLRRAQTDGVLEFEHSANPLQEPASVFIKTIGGVGGADGQFWTYYINNELAKEGCGTCSAKPGDSIRWVYGQPPAELN